MSKKLLIGSGARTRRIAIYTTTNKNELPEFNEGYKYRATVAIIPTEDPLYQIKIYSKDDFSKIRFKPNTVEVKELTLTDKVTTLESMFDGCSKLISVNANGWDTNSARSMSRMFYGCSALTDIEYINRFSTANVEDMSEMFRHCKSLTELDLHTWNTVKVKNMTRMFENCMSMTNIVLSTWQHRWNTNNVENMSWMFNYCSNLTTVDVSDFKTSKVKDMSYMFQGCKKLYELEVDNWDTSNVENMSYMFDGANIANGELNLSKWTTPSLVNMTCMFRDLTCVKELDLANFTTDKVVDMSYLFSGVRNVVRFDVSGWVTDNVNNMACMFKGCRSMQELDLHTWNTTNVEHLSEMFYSCDELEKLNLSNWNVYNVRFLNETFAYCPRLSELNIDGWNVYNVVNMDEMFANTHSLVNLNLSTWYTHKCSTFKKVFYNSTALESLDLSNWHVRNVDSWTDGLKDCRNLKYIKCDNESTLTAIVNADICDRTGKDPGLVQTMFNTSRFEASLNKKNWELLQVGEKEYDIIFETKGSKKVVIDNFDIEPFINTISEENGVYTCGYRGDYIEEISFNGNNGIVKIVKLDPTRITNISRIFKGCSSLEEVDFSEGLDEFVQGGEEMFSGCTNLKSVKLPKIQYDEPFSIYAMYNGCSSLENIDLTCFSGSTVNNMISTFNGCSNVKSIDISDISLDYTMLPNKAITKDSLFNCAKLTDIKIKNYTMITDFADELRYCASYEDCIVDVQGKYPYEIMHEFESDLVVMREKGWLTKHEIAFPIPYSYFDNRENSGIWILAENNYADNYSKMFEEIEYNGDIAYSLGSGYKPFGPRNAFIHIKNEHVERIKINYDIDFINGIQYPEDTKFGIGVGSNEFYLPQYNTLEASNVGIKEYEFIEHNVVNSKDKYVVVGAETHDSEEIRTIIKNIILYY